MVVVLVVVVAIISMFFPFLFLFLVPIFFNAPPLPFQAGSQTIDVFRLLKASFVLLFTVFTFLAALPMMSWLFVAIVDQGRW